MWALKFIVKFIIVLIVAGLSAEVYFRYSSPRLKMLAFQNNLLFKVWNREKLSLAMPPFNIVSNRDWDKKDRLEDVYVYSFLPPNGDYEATDFLRVKNIPYKIHINSLGFRGHEISPEKKKNIYRVISLGSYMTFGHGVNDDQTYSAVAESLLNLHSKSTQFEILNGGMETGSFILGLSRLHNESDTLKPDAVIFEYGFMDGSPNGSDDKIADNFLELKGIKKAKTEQIDILQWAERNLYQPMLAGPLRSSLTVAAVFDKLRSLLAGNVNFNFSQMQEALTQTALQLKKRGIKVYLLRDPILLQNLPAEFFQNIAKATGAVVVDGYAAFQENPPTPAEFIAFDNDTFLSEIGLERRSDVCGKLYTNYGPYFQNLFQLSPLGHAVIAKALAAAIEADRKR